MALENIDRESLMGLQKEFKCRKDKLFSDEEQSPEVYNKNSLSLFRPLIDYARNPQLPLSDRPLPLDILTLILSRIAKISPAKADVLIETEGGYVQTTFKEEFMGLFLSSFDSNYQPLVKASKECLGAFVSAFLILYGESEKSLFVESLVSQILSRQEGKPRSKGEYYLLDLLVAKKWITARFILERAASSKLLVRLIQELSNRSLAPSLGKFIGLVLSRYRIELQGLRGDTADIDLEDWVRLLTEPLVFAMSEDELVRMHIELYVIPGTFKDCKPGFKMFVRGIPAQVQEPQKLLCTVLSCLRIGQSQGWVEEHELDHLLPAQHPLSNLVTHRLNHIRLSSLELLIVTPKNANPLPRSSIGSIKGCLDDFFAETDPDFRGKIFSIYRSLVDRLLTSCYATAILISKSHGELVRKGETPQALERLEVQKTVLRDQRNFVEWILKELLPSQLRVGSSYQRTILALKIYTLWFAAPDVNHRLSGPSKGAARDENVHFPFPLEYDNPKLRRLLVEKIMDPFEDVRATAASLLKQLPLNHDLAWSDILGRAGAVLATAGRAGEADGVCRIMEAIFDISTRKGEVIVSELWGRRLSKSNEVVKDFFEWAIGILESSLEKGGRGGILDAVNEGGKGIFGILGGLRLIFDLQGLPRLLGSGNEAALVDNMLRLLKSCEDIWSITREVLSLDSPTDGAGDDLNYDEVAPEAYNSGLGSRAILSFSWRAVSEASALLETMARNLPRNRAFVSGFLKRCGRLFLTQLSTMRHRGSLLAVSPAFLTICTRCLSDPSREISSLPIVWLEEEMSNIRVRGNLVTRRSAGLPIIISSIVKAEAYTVKVPSERNILRTTFAKLIQIVNGNSGSIPKSTIESATENFVNKDESILDAPQVHALNCIRQLFMDSRLSSSTDIFVSDALRISISCFSSNLWSLRNCGIMLFTTLSLRIFGSGTGKSVYTVDSFFETFAGVKELIMGVLQKAASGLEDHTSIDMESVYPALSLISQLHRNPSNESPDTIVFGLRELVLQFLTCRFWKIRDAAARAFVPLVEGWEDMALWVTVFLDWTCRDDPRESNVIHGGLSAARRLVEEGLQSSAPEQNAARRHELSRIIVSRFDRFMNPSSCSCAVNRAMYQRLVRKVVLPTADGRDLLKECIREYFNGKDLQHILRSRDIGGPLLCIEAARNFALTFPTESIELLHTRGPEVGQAVAECFCSSDLHLDISAETQAELWNKVESKGEWEPYRVSLIEFLCKFTKTFQLKSLQKALELAEKGNTVPLREVALVYCGNWIQKSSDSDRKRWQALLENFSDENKPHSSRLAALRSITYCLEKQMSREPETSLLPTYFTLHKLLNDDEDDIRRAAASTACTLLSIWAASDLPQTALQECQLTSAVASRRILEALCRLPKHADAQHVSCLGNLLLKESLSISSLHFPEEVGKQLKTASTPNTLLFKFEKQNLYYDRCRNMDLFTECLLDILPAFIGFAIIEGEIDINLVSVLETYTRTALSKVLELLTSYKALHATETCASDGYLGWSTTIDEDLFIIGLRCANAFSLGCSCFRIGRVGNEQLSSWAELVSLVRTLVSEGEREDVCINEEWLQRFRKGLEIWGAIEG